MRLDNLDQINQIAPKTNFSIFELPMDIDFGTLFTNSYHVKLEYNEKTKKYRNVITKSQIDEAKKIAQNKQSETLFIVIEDAETLNDEAANTFLKALEEPSEHIHYIFLTHNLSKIIPTIKSRASCYYLAKPNKATEAPSYDSDVIALAKEYIGSKPGNLPTVVEKIIKSNKDDPRRAAMQVVECGIELMQKSYLMLGNQAFLTKIEQLIATKEALAQNGHVKLQLIANML